jgi:hypothetical protein
MTASPIYSNHAGTMSESFAIGKRGVQLLQGTSSPVGISAPVGSLYLLKGVSGNRVYQVDASGVWTALLSPDDLVAGAGVALSNVDGVITISTPITKYKKSFTNSDLTMGALTVTHNLIEDYPIVQIYNDSKKIIIADSVSSTSNSVVFIDLTSYGAITGTWAVTVLSN